MDRGARGNTRGRGSGTKRGGAPNSNVQEKPKREAILDLTKYVGTRIKVSIAGGRQVTGVLKGFDQLLNLVLDDVEEEASELQQHPRNLGLAVLRGPTITLVAPADGFEEIDDPFAEG